MLVLTHQSIFLPAFKKIEKTDFMGVAVACIDTFVGLTIAASYYICCDAASRTHIIMLLLL